MRYTKPRFIAVDFFCGAGGTTRGLLDAGGYVLAGVDRDPRCKDTYVRNNVNTTLDSRPPHFLDRDVFPACDEHPAGQQARLLRELDDLISRYRGLAPDQPFVFAVCAPCQPFTTLSKKELSRGRIEKRGRDQNLLSEALAYIERYRPDIVLSENVEGITDPKFGGIWTAFADGLRALGYLVGAGVVCASQFGVPQYRRRSILVAGLRRKLQSSLRNAEVLVLPLGDEEAGLVDVRSAIGHLPAIRAGEHDPTVANHRARSLSETNLARIAAAKPGQSNAYLASTPHGDLSLDCHRRAKAKVGTACFTDVYTRMRPDRPSPTITTKCHSISNGRFGHYDTRQDRGLSLREAAALQSFSDDYVFEPSSAIEAVAAMIGNAVPPLLARFFADFAVRLLETRSVPEISAASV